MTNALLATTNEAATNEGMEIQSLPAQVIVDMALAENGFTYQSGKTVKTAYTPSEVARAPKAALLKVADARTMHLLSHGKYKGFMQSIENLLSKKHLRLLVDYLNTCINEKGRPLLVSNDGKRRRQADFESFKGAVNKQIFRATAQWLAKPVEYDKNDTEIPFNLPKSKQWLTETAKVWLAANPA